MKDKDPEQLNRALAKMQEFDVIARLHKEESEAKYLEDMAKGSNSSLILDSLIATPIEEPKDTELKEPDPKPKEEKLQQAFYWLIL